MINVTERDGKSTDSTTISALRLEQVQRRLVFALDLFHGALLGSLFRPPPQEFRPVTETASGEVIELNLND